MVVTALTLKERLSIAAELLRTSEVNILFILIEKNSRARKHSLSLSRVGILYSMNPLLLYNIKKHIFSIFSLFLRTMHMSYLCCLKKETIQSQSKDIDHHQVCVCVRACVRVCVISSSS